MPPKRKAASKPDPVEPPAKRATRASQPVASTSAAPKVKAPAKAKAAPRKKKVEVVEIESSDADDSDGMVIEELKGKKRAPAPAPAPKKAPAPAPVKKVVKSPAEKKPVAKKPVKAAAPAPVASTSAKNSIDQEYAAEGVQGVTSTSTTPLPEPVPRPKPKPKSPKKPVSWEQGLKDWFAEYEDEPGKMGGDGIERLFLNMDVSMEGPAPFILAYKVGAKPGTFGSFAFDDFQTTFREPKVNSDASLKAYLATAEKEFFGKTSTEYDAFYAWTFNFVKEEGQKSLAGETGTALWRILLQPRYSLAKSFVDYTETLGAGFKGVSSDLWHQLLEFAKSTDENLAGFNEMDAWPTAIDQFVEWKKEQAASS